MSLFTCIRKFLKHYSLSANPYRFSSMIPYISLGDNKYNLFNILKVMFSSVFNLWIYNAKGETEIHCDTVIDYYGAVQG